MASMKKSATGSTADPSGPGGGTGASGTRVKRLGIRPRVLRGCELVRDRGDNVTFAATHDPDHHEALDRAVDHHPRPVAGPFDRAAVHLDDDAPGPQSCGVRWAGLDDLDHLETAAPAV